MHNYQYSTTRPLVPDAPGHRRTAFLARPVRRWVSASSRVFEKQSQLFVCDIPAIPLEEFHLSLQYQPFQGH
jgi:hypothetical protein